MSLHSAFAKRMRLFLFSPNTDTPDQIPARLGKEFNLKIHQDLNSLLPSIRAEQPDIVIAAVYGEHFEWLPTLRTAPESRDIPVARMDGKSSSHVQYHGNAAVDFDDYLHESMSDQEISARIYSTVNGARARAKINKRQQLFAEIDDATRPLSDPNEITLVAATLVGKYLNVNRCAYADVEADQDTFNLTGNYNNDVPSIVGRYSFAQFGAECLRLMRAGLPYIVEDSETDPRTLEARESYRLTSIRSVICVPLMKSGRFVVAMAVHQKTPRAWQSHEAELLLQVAGRCWESIERTRVSRVLLDNEARYRTLVETISAVIWHTDINGYVIAENPSWGAFTGQSFKEYRGSGWLNAIHAEDRDIVLQTWTAATKVQNRFTCQYRLRRHDGAYRFMSASGAPVWMSGDKQGEWIGNCVDITESKRAEEELRAGDRRKDEFLAMLAHELRNPLAPVIAAAELLQIVKIDEARVRHTSEIIARQVKHMTALVDDLLDVSRVTQGLISLDEDVLDVKKIAAEAIEQVRPLMEARRHHMAVHTQLESALVRGDHKRLVQVVANLLHNSAKYTPEGGNILLEIKAQDKEVMLSVKDNGVGMESELVQRAFELFTQAERTIDRAKGGLGIGLALVKSLVELHKGSVKAYSEGVGKGSIFTICLPRSCQKGKDTKNRDARTEILTLSRPLKIMVVDDNADAADTIAMLLESLGHEVLVEYSSHKALERARTERPEICLLDIGLPEMNGNDLARLLRTCPETEKSILVALTGYGQEQDKKKAFEAGFNHHFPKPIDMAKLANLLCGISKA